MKLNTTGAENSTVKNVPSFIGILKEKDLEDEYVYKIDIDNEDFVGTIIVSADPNYFNTKDPDHHKWYHDVYSVDQMRETIRDDMNVITSICSAYKAIATLPKEVGFMLYNGIDTYEEEHLNPILTVWWNAKIEEEED